MDTFKRPMDIEFGPDGSLYMIDWGTGFGGNNLDSGIYRIDYVVGARRPVATATATPDSGPTPLDVQFSSTGSHDPDGTAAQRSTDDVDGRDRERVAQHRRHDPAEVVTTEDPHDRGLKDRAEDRVSRVDAVLGERPSNTVNQNAIGV